MSSGGGSMRRRATRPPRARRSCCGRRRWRGGWRGAVQPYLRFDVSTGVVQAGYGARWAASGAGREMGRVFAEPDQHLGLLDLRGWGEASIVDTAVRIYRSR